jgi:hypothetical protein
MAMFSRAPKSTPPLRRRQEELIRREAELRERVEQLERTISNASRITGDPSRPRREEGRTRTNTPDKRFHVSVALQDERYSNESESIRRPRSLRKERREGRMVFLVLVIALAAAVIWLVSHLHF